jgi:hypothetical protein
MRVEVGKHAHETAPKLLVGIRNGLSATTHVAEYVCDGAQAHWHRAGLLPQRFSPGGGDGVGLGSLVRLASKESPGSGSSPAFREKTGGTSKQTFAPLSGVQTSMEGFSMDAMLICRRLGLLARGGCFQVDWYRAACRWLPLASPHPTTKLVANCKTAGFEGYFSRSFDLGELTNTILGILGAVLNNSRSDRVGASHSQGLKGSPTWLVGAGGDPSHQPGVPVCQFQMPSLASERNICRNHAPIPSKSLSFIQTAGPTAPAAECVLLVLSWCRFFVHSPWGFEPLCRSGGE